MSGMFKNEDLADRVGVKPILNDDMWDMYKKGLQTLWFVEDVSLVEDVKQWKTLDPKLKHFLKYILSFFHGADKLVADNASINFVEEIPILEAQVFYRFQGMAEDIHSDMYSSLVDALIPDNMEKEEIFNAVSTMPVIKAKTDWAIKYSDRNGASLPERIVAFAIMEGVFFSGSFCAIYYVRDQGKLPGLCFSNDYISRDEGEHCRFACLIYSKIKDEYRLPEEKIHAIFSEAVKIESEFITEAIPVSMIGMSSDLMIQYIKSVADHWMVELGYSRLYKVDNPFTFMNMISVSRKTNFFEKRAGEYSRANVGQSKDDQAFVIDEDEDF